MKKTITALLLFALLALPAFANDLFLKLDSYFVKVNQKISISVMNGTFQKSEGAVSFARLTDVSVVSPSGSRTHPVEADLTKNETTAFFTSLRKRPVITLPVYRRYGVKALFRRPSLTNTSRPKASRIFWRTERVTASSIRTQSIVTRNMSKRSFRRGIKRLIATRLFSDTPSRWCPSKIPTN